MAEKQKTGLVMEGGAMRGLFTCGVIDVMMENGITFDGAIGVSAGASFGCNYKSHQIGRVLRYTKRFSHDPRFCGVRTYLRTGDLYGAEFCYHELPEKLDVFDTETFRNNPMEFYVVCTDADTGRPVYHRCTDGGWVDLEYIRASASMPVVSHPVELKGKRLLDGGISDSIPLRFFEHIGYTKNVVILTQPDGYVKEPQKGIGLLHVLLHSCPLVARDLAERHLVYNDELRYVKKQAEAGHVLVIRPESALDIGKTEHDPDKLQAVYDIGRRTGRKALPEIASFLEEDIAV